MCLHVFREWVDQGNKSDTLLETKFPPNSYLCLNFTSFLTQVPVLHLLQILYRLYGSKKLLLIVYTKIFNSQSDYV